MKRAVKAVATALLALLLAFFPVCFLTNDRSAQAVADGLAALPLPEDTQRLETVSRAGKLAGCGNGMQYFGAILLESPLTLEELDAYYAPYRADEWSCVVERQEGQGIRAVEHGGLSFSAPVGERCYVVYSWGEGVELFALLDPRGH